MEDAEVCLTRASMETKSQFGAVTPSLELVPPYDTKKLSRGDIFMLQEETLKRLADISSLLRHVFVVKVVVNPRRNFLNIRVQRFLLATIFVSRQTNTTIFFVLSDKLQRFANIISISDEGEVACQNYSEAICAQVTGACREFKKAFGIGGETYQVAPPAAPPIPCESLSKALSTLRSCQQAPTRLQMRVATQMYHDRLPIMKMFSSEKVRALIAIAESTTTQKKEKLIQVDAFLRNTLEHIPGYDNNFCLKANFLTSLYQARKVDTCFEFHLSDKIEPYVIIIAFDPSSNGNLVSLSPEQLLGLEEAIKEFAAQYKCVYDELLFHYTTKTERFETDTFSANAARGTKAHSTVFHLKMKVSSEFYIKHFPILRWLPMNEMMGLDTVKYNFSRETMPWDDVLLLLQNDCVPSFASSDDATAARASTSSIVVPHQNKKRKMKPTEPTL